MRRQWIAEDQVKWSVDLGNGGVQHAVPSRGENNAGGHGVVIAVREWIVRCSMWKRVRVHKHLVEIAIALVGTSNAISPAVHHA